MFHRLSLRSRIFFLLGALILTNLAGSLVTLWYIDRTQNMYTSQVDRDVAALLAAQELETALVMQKGFVTYYFLNENPEWLERLDEHHQSFERWLAKARNAVYLPEARPILNEIEAAYLAYIFSRDNVIGLYKNGNREEGAREHWDIRDQFHHIYSLCERFKRVHQDSIYLTRRDYEKSVQWLTGLAYSAIPGSIFLGLLLSYILFQQVLEPIKRLALEPDESGIPLPMGDEVKALRNRFHHLLEDVDQTHTKLEESREHLMQSEKMAVVGKMAAGVAHSIRNPLTSLKMRLFSLERSLNLNPTQREDLEVISEEIRHIDTVVRNFLEFSRPHKLKVQPIIPSDVVDMTLQLLKHRIESHGVEIETRRKEKPARILADPEQLKEVLVNLLLNAFEALGEGGKILIEEEEKEGQAVVLRVTDNGPGVPQSIREKIFLPFFSTKEEGTGLGLSIVKRIIQEHRGQLNLYSEEGRFTTFEIVLPIKEAAA